MSKILGIDLGTTNSAMAVVEGGEATIIENKEGNRTTPSVVAINKAGERLVGQIAKRQAVTNPKDTIFSVKRLIGRSFGEAEIQEDVKLLPYEIIKANGGIKVKMGGKEHSPQEVSAMILQKLKADAEDKLGEKITDVIITVPAYFDDSQRQATKDAGEIAGLNVKRIINEPTAAALAYGLNKKKDEQIVVYDLGGGTFDVSVLEVGEIENEDGKKESRVEVKATHGDTHLGGDDFDQKIIDWIVSEFKKLEGIDLSKDQMALQRLKEATEKAKHELSTTMQTEINQPFITTDANGPKHLNLSLSRAKLEELVGDLAKKTLESCKAAIKEAGFEIKDIDEVVLVGGQTRMPLIQKIVEDFFGKKPHVGVNPDEIVAIGAAIQGAISMGDMGKDVLLLDVTPLSLGIETMGGISTKLIEKNTTIPTNKTQVFSTAADSQPSVDINILQGEREMASGNKSLGRFMLDGIPPAPRGVPQIEVSFDIDVNGILNVSAKDKATGREQKITIQASSGLSKDEIENMKKDAEVHADEDKKKKELIELKNTAETLIYSTEKTLKDGGDKIKDEDKKEMDGKIEALKKVKDSDNLEEIKKASDDLGQAIQKVGAQMYQQAQQTAQADKTEQAMGTKDAGDDPVSAKATADEEVKDAEFTDKK